MKAVYQGVTIAESDQTVAVEGNHYFPASSIDMSKLDRSEHKSVCPWKGTASYYDVKVGDKVATNAAWVYPEAKTEAKNIEGHFAFWNGVEIEQ